MKKNTRHFEIFSSAGMSMGIWEAETAEQAIRLMNADAGCDDLDRDDGLTVEEVPMKGRETVKIAMRRDAEGRRIYTYARKNGTGGWIAPISYCHSSIAAATQDAMADGFKVDRRGVLQF